MNTDLNHNKYIMMRLKVEDKMQMMYFNLTIQGTTKGMMKFSRPLIVVLESSLVAKNQDDFSFNVNICDH